jgi:hypothetical protein
MQGQSELAFHLGETEHTLFRMPAYPPRSRPRIASGTSVRISPENLAYGRPSLAWTPGSEGSAWSASETVLRPPRSASQPVANRDMSACVRNAYSVRARVCSGSVPDMRSTENP